MQATREAEETAALLEQFGIELSAGGLVLMSDFAKAESATSTAAECRAWQPCAEPMRGAASLGILECRDCNRGGQFVKNCCHRLSSSRFQGHLVPWPRYFLWYRAQVRIERFLPAMRRASAALAPALFWRGLAVLNYGLCPILCPPAAVNDRETGGAGIDQSIHDCHVSGCVIGRAPMLDPD
jgi:hypothetical protein